MYRFEFHFLYRVIAQLCIRTYVRTRVHRWRNYHECGVISVSRALVNGCKQ